MARATAVARLAHGTHPVRRDAGPLSPGLRDERSAGSLAGACAAATFPASKCPRRALREHSFAATPAADRAGRPVRPAVRARRLRRRVRRAAERRAEPRDGPAGDHRPGEPRAPRRGGRRPEHGRRRGDAAAAARRAPARRVGGELPPAGPYGVAVCFLPAGRRAPRRARAAAQPTPSRPRASASSAGATSRSRRTTSASPPTGSRPTSSSSSSAAVARARRATRTPSSASST